MSKTTKTSKINDENQVEYEFEYDEYDPNENIDSSHFNIQFIEDESENIFPNERVYMEDLYQRVSSLLSHRWLTIDQIYLAFNCQDSRSSISTALGKLDKDHKMLFWNDTFSLKTRN